ncbi:hypothetical protein CUZ87_2403 [Enterococcus xinjiangensis]|nr:hypothetical protein [Enterococcus lactis]
MPVYQIENSLLPYANHLFPFQRPPIFFAKKFLYLFYHQFLFMLAAGQTFLR